jgi:hypothetical protein
VISESVCAVPDGGGAFQRAAALVLGGYEQIIFADFEFIAKPGERPDVAVDPVIVEPQAVQHFARLALERVAAEMLVLLLHFTKPRQDRVHLAGLRGIAHRVLERVEFVVQLPCSTATRNGLVEHGPARHLLHVLPEVAHRQLLRDGHLPVVRRLVARDQTE